MLLERARLVFVLVVACGLVLALGGGMAQASTTAYVEVGRFGKEGAGAGEFKGPTGVAIQQSTGDVYVVDGKNLRVQKFGPAGEFILAFGKDVDETTGGDVCTAVSHDVCKAGKNDPEAGHPEPGQFGETLIFGFIHGGNGPAGVAVDPETSDVYVADRANRRVEKFSSGGVFLGVLEHEFSESSSEQQLGADAVAVDPILDSVNGGHDVYVTDAGNNVVDVFDAAGAYLRQISGLAIPDGVAFDSGGNAYVLNKETKKVYEFMNGEGAGAELPLEEELAEAPEAIALDTAGDVFIAASHVIKFSPAGKVLAGEFGEGSSHPSGIAVNDPGDKAYFEGSSDKVGIFEEKTGQPPVVTTGEASALTPSGATLTGTVKPEGFPTEYWFKYGLDETYSSGCGSEGCTTPRTSTVSTTGEEAVTVSLAGLEPHATYHYRLLAKSAFGEIEGQDKTLTTPGTPPTVGSELTELITETDALLLAEIDPENQDTHYYFQYSTDPSLESGVSTIPAPSGEDIGSGLQTRRALQDIGGGLTPNTTYYYRVVAENATPPATDGPIQSFTTYPLQPTASTGEPSAVTDTTATISGVLDGMGADTHFYFNYVDDAGYKPTEPDPYAAGEETPSPAADAGVVSSDTPESIQLTGLTPHTTYHYQLVAYNALCPFFCPPPRQSAPGQSAEGLDVMFTTLALPPVAVADASGGNISPNSATVTGSADLQGVAGSYHFEYGSSTAYDNSTAVGTLGASVGGQAVNADISGLSPNTTYHYRLVVTNNDGTDYSADETFATYTTAPAVSTGQATSVGQSTATLGGSLDPQGADTSYWFQYGTTAYYSTNVPAPGADVGSGSGFQSVTQSIGGLTPGTTYHFRLVTNNAGGTSYGADQTFTTASASPATATPTITTTTTPNATSPPKTATVPQALTRAQKLAKALKACAKKSKKQRASCEKRAHKQFGPVKRKK